jgi:two-component system sensor histidine kinase BaeS
LKKSLRAKLSSAILIIVLITIAIISFLSNYFINRQFTEYVIKQHKLKTQIIQSSLSQQYTQFTNSWNLDYIHAIGMLSLYEGYIIKIYDKDKNILWDAQAHDMNLCNEIMNDISERMRISYPRLDGEFTSTDYMLMQNSQVIGSVSISSFGPFFFNENDYKFLRSLNVILISVGLTSLAVSLIVGAIMAKRISQPILKTVHVTKQIADGRYDVRLEERSNTREIDMLVNSINNMAVSLDTMEKLRKQLTEDVAHELRTPIAILQSYLEAMQEGIWDATSERLQSCYEEVIRIGKIVGDMEKLATLEGDNLKLDKQRMDLLSTIEKTVISLEGEIRNKKLNVEIRGEHIELLADYDRIRQVILNLLSNSIKYSNEGGNIIFELFERPDSIGFTIRDNGIGISEEDLPFIFERFYRADKSRNRATGGSGIGLTIVKSIVQAHGGQITVESILGEGSKFTVTLPDNEDEALCN